MPVCDRCTRQISAQEAVIVPVKEPDKNNEVYCPECSQIVLSQRQKAANNPWPGFILKSTWLALVLALVWYILFPLTGSAWNFLAAFVGWSVARTLVRINPGIQSSKLKLIAVDYTILAIAVKEYFVLTSMIAFTNNPGVRPPIFNLYPSDVVLSRLTQELTLQPFTILIWTLAIWIAYISSIRSYKPSQTGKL